MNPGIGKTMQSNPTSAHMNPTTLPAGDRGDISPYPTVVIVIIAHQSEKFQNSIFEPKLTFLRENRINHNKCEFLDFYEFLLYMNFANFLKMAISIMAIFSENFVNHI